VTGSLALPALSPLECSFLARGQFPHVRVARLVQVSCASLNATAAASSYTASIVLQGASGLVSRSAAADVACDGVDASRFVVAVVAQAAGTCLTTAAYFGVPIVGSGTVGFIAAPRLRGVRGGARDASRGRVVHCPVCRYLTGCGTRAVVYMPPSRADPPPSIDRVTPAAGLDKGGWTLTIEGSVTHCLHILVRVGGMPPRSAR